MYPKIFIEYFREHERSKEVFVAIPFSKPFRQRWDDIFVPAIEGLGLTPYRVDKRSISDSILTDILSGICRAKLVLADISTNKRSSRNGNVMYELGLAHATRMPEEAVIVRSDKGKLLFDINQVRVRSFSPANTRESIDLIKECLVDALKEIDLTRDMIVKKVQKQLDHDSMYVMAMEADKDTFTVATAEHGNYGHLEWQEARIIFRKLQELQIFESEIDSDARPVKYRWSSLGRAVKAKLKDTLDSYRR